MIDLTIAVLTFRRPADLGAVLPLLVEEATANAGPDLRIRVVVVDNDPEGGAAAQVRSFAQNVPVTVDYVNETTPGISAARNRALSESGDSRLLVFIDDDERPTAEWLHLLLQTWRETGAAAVVGPVVSDFEIDPEPWIVAGGYFVRRRLPTGTRVNVAGTNNLLLDLDFVRAKNITFDPALGLSGGEDTMFTRQIVSSGGEIVWCDEAIVLDFVPAKRVSRRWVVLRALSSGNAWSITSVKLARGSAARLNTRVRLTARGGARVLGGTGRIVAGLGLRRVALRARGVRTFMRGAGMVTGAWGYKYIEYRRPARAESIRR
ncbi:MAG TPA: glycosyltransferase [Pseudolysinimonas sp.]|nr:glycosyltransferase [Pseudolysinimonas sp.]